LSAAATRARAATRVDMTAFRASGAELALQRLVVQRKEQDGVDTLPEQELSSSTSWRQLRVQPPPESTGVEGPMVSPHAVQPDCLVA